MTNTFTKTFKCYHIQLPNRMHPCVYYIDIHHTNKKDKEAIRAELAFEIRVRTGSEPESFDFNEVNLKKPVYVEIGK